MNKYLTKLNLPISLYLDVSKIDSNTQYQHNITPDDIDEQFTKWLDTLGIKVHWCEILYLPPWRSYKIHVDGELYDREDKGKLNYIIGSSGSRMTWYYDPEIINEDVMDNGKPRVTVPMNQLGSLREMHSENVPEGFVIASVGIFHTVRNLSEPRYCLTMAIEDSVTGDRLTYTDMWNRFREFHDDEE